METKPSPCPLCGLTDELTIDTLGDPEDWFIECERCRIGTHAIFRGREATITAWNTRPLESANEERIKALEEALRGVIDVGKPARGMFELWSEWDLRVRAYDKARAALAEEKKP